ncbi:MAG: substrate-binding domain-containing protein [Anaerolineae bacterium]|nr:substrate-binding domain-containing protein [Anaerolineae bacterium]
MIAAARAFLAKQVYRLSLMLLAAAMLAFPAHPTAQAQGNDPLKIGLLTDLSGQYVIYGIELENGLTLGLDYATGGTLEVAGRPVELLVRDYANDPELAITQARELIEVEGIDILVGAPGSGVTRGLIDVAAEYDVILMAGPAADPRITGEFFALTTFRACRNVYHDALGLAAWSVEHVGTTYIQLAPDYAFGYGLTAAFDYGFEARGAEFAQAAIYAPTGTTEFEPYLRQVIDSGADGVIITWAGIGLIDLFQQAHELGLGVDEDKPMIITGFSSNDIVLAFADGAQIGSTGVLAYYYTLPDNDVNDWLIAQHRARYDDVPDLFTECGFATGQAIVAGVMQADGSTAPEDLILALEGLEWEGPKGAYTMRPEDHQALMPMYVVRLTNLDDPDQALYELVAEIPPDDTAPPCEAGADRSSDTLDCTPLADR